MALGAALVSASGASAAGDPVQDGKLALNLTGGFKKALERNGIRLTPRRFDLKPGSSLVDPVTGASELRLKGKLLARAHGRRVTATKLKVSLEDQGGTLAGPIKGVIKGRRIGLFQLRAGPPGKGVTRVDWGARVEGIRARISRRFALKLNRSLGLHSLRAGGRVGRASIAEQPQTVQVTGGYMFVDVPMGYLPPSNLFGSGKDPNSILAKLPAHCVGPILGVQIIPGPDPNNPARLSIQGQGDDVLGFPPISLAAIFRFPVVGGSVGPGGKTGQLQLEGGISVLSGASDLDGTLFANDYGPDCAMEAVGPDTSSSILESTYDNPGDPNTGPDLTLGKFHSFVTLKGQTPGCTFSDGGPVGCGLNGTGGPGFKGQAVGQLLNLSVATVNSDPNAHTVTIGNVPIVNNGLAATTFNQLFERASVFPSGGNPAHSPMDFVNGDKFGIGKMNLTTR
jgi:hypothetical protein